MNTSRSLGLVASLLGVGALLAGCASPADAGDSPAISQTAPGAALGSVAPGLPDGEVMAQGTVMDVAGDVQLCLGGILESYPPQCSGTGLPIAGWSWDGVDGAETSGEITWGAYAVQGTYDGTTFTSTQAPIMLALYDPMVPDDPTNGEPGPADEATLLTVQGEIHDALGDQALSSWPQDGRLWVQVVWDDGTVQDAADATYGDDVVVIQSALHEVG